MDDEPPEADPKKRYGIGTSTYMKAVNNGHQLCQSTQPCIVMSPFIFFKESGLGLLTHTVDVADRRSHQYL